MENKINELWYVYILRCEDNSLYTGIAKDYLKRYSMHIEGKGAKYTKIRKPLKIECVFEFKNRSEASKEEYRIKKLTKIEKEKIIDNFKKVIK